MLIASWAQGAVPAKGERANGMTVNPYPKFWPHLFSERALAAHGERRSRAGPASGYPSSRPQTHLNEFRTGYQPRNPSHGGESENKKKRPAARRFAPITMTDRSDHDGRNAHTQEMEAGANTVCN